MPPDVDSTQATAEPASPAASSPPDSAPAASTEKPQLASLDDALKAQEAKPSRASTRERRQPRPTDSDATATPAAAVKPDASPPSPDADPATTESTDPGDSTETASTPGQDGNDEAGKPSRRERAAIRDLTAERDTLRAEVESLRAQTAIPDHIRQAAIDVRLTDEEFARLEEKLKREDITQDYLTPEEREQYTRALQVRDWSAPWYADARQQATAWAAEQRQEVVQQAAEQLSPVLRARPYIPHEPIGQAATWTAVYDHIADSALAEGRRLERASLQPKLDEATGRINDLEMELSGFRHRPGRDGDTLERGGVSGGAYNGRPDFKTSSASDLFTAAFAQQERSRTRRRAS